MKTIITLFSLFIALTAMFSNSVYAAEVYAKIIPLQKYTLQYDTSHDIDPNGKRIPSRPIVCTITPQGISFPDSFNIEVVAYEVWSIAEEATMASFSEEKDFLEYLFNSPADSDLQIRLITPEYKLIGTLSI